MWLIVFYVLFDLSVDVFDYVFCCVVGDDVLVIFCVVFCIEWVWLYVGDGDCMVVLFVLVEVVCIVEFFGYV